MPYVRPDMERVLADFDAIAARLDAAKSAEEQIAAYEAADVIKKRFMTAAALASVRHTIDTRDEFYTAFKHDIITSKLKPGELLKEKQIMQDYGIGRLPMREIMVRLQQENLIETIPRMGTVVTRLDIKHMRDVVELRLELECVVAKLAAERITDEQLGNLRELVEKIHSCADGKSDAAAAWDAQFHQLLYEAAGNAELTRVVNDLLQTMMRLWYYLELWDKDFLSDADGAPNILKALEKRDPDLAQKAMRVHINYSVSRAVTGKFDLA